MNEGKRGSVCGSSHHPDPDAHVKDGNESGKQVHKKRLAEKREQDESLSFLSIEKRKRRGCRSTRRSSVEDKTGVREEKKERQESKKQG